VTYCIYFSVIRTLNMAKHFGGKNGHVYDGIKNLNEIISILIMSIVFFSLLYFMNRYYKRELKSSLKSLVFFFVCEQFFVGMTIIDHGLHFFNSHYHHYVYWFKKILYALGGYPIQQALCLIYLK
jgi:energy-coupling factor transporter transmembrane protein EcfT